MVIGHPTDSTMTNTNPSETKCNRERVSLYETVDQTEAGLLGLWFDSPLLATILATGGISIFGDSSW
jgi:hypothetical protein